MMEMTRQEVTQMGADNIGVLAGSDLPEAESFQFPCEECGGMVDLSAPIKVTMMEMDGTEVFTTMPEAEARALLAEVGIPPPPVLCDQHERFEFQGTRDA